MKIRLTIFAAISVSGLLWAQQSNQPAANQPSAAAPAPEDSGLLLKTETKLVLVDAIVTDKKGAYVGDLKLKDFRVTEDGKDQPIKTFSFEADPASGASERTHYLVLFFDNSTMNPGDQVQARQAAQKFIDTNAGPNRMMAVVNFGGSMQIAQNFTTDPERLKAAVSGIKMSAVSPNDNSVGAAPISRNGATTVAMDFAARDMLQTIRSLAKSLGSNSGRKSLVLFTAGFRLTNEQQSEVTATIAECNKSNVAVYPVDVRGLTTGGLGMAPKALLLTPLPALPSLPQRSVFQTVAFVPPLPFAPQARGGGGAAGGGATGGGAAGGGASSGGGRGAAAPTAPSAPVSSGGRGASTPTGPAPSPTSPGSAGGRGPGQVGGGGQPPPGAMMNGCPGGGPMGGPMGGGTMPSGSQMPGAAGCQSRTIIPRIPETSTTNQQVMFMLADGTGGFVIHDSNDLLSGLTKIGKEQNQYYILGYTPPDAKAGSCHVLHVKVDRGGVEVRARTGYCSGKPLDVLAHNPVEKTMEAKLSGAQPGPVTGSMQLPYFYTAPNVARVNLAMEISPAMLKFEKKKNDFHSEVNFLGIAYTPEGTVAARFSDTLNLDYPEKVLADASKQNPLHYENQFDIAAGKYTLKVVYSEGGDNFGKLEMPLEIEPYKSDQLAISGLALSKEYHRTSELGAGLDTALLEDKTPLIADGLQIVPTGNPAFAKSDLAILYVELYEPLLTNADPKNVPVVAIRMRILDRKSGEEKSDSGFLRLDPAPPAGNPVVPLGEKMPVTGLKPGAYRLEFTVADAANNQAKRTADFDLQ